MEVFHFPPELFALLVETIPRLIRSKKDLLLFFQGAGIPKSLVVDLTKQVSFDPKSITKFDIVRQVLTRLNERGEAMLKQRREVLKRIVEFEDFSTCWPSQQLAAKGLVAELRRVVGVKDSFTRMVLAKEEERHQHQQQRETLFAAEREKKARFDQVQKNLFALFGENDAHKRGKALEAVLNGLFKAAGILVMEAFSLKGSVGQGVIEQIDGVISLDGELYLVEMKWWNAAIGPGDLAQHLVRVFNRGCARGIFIACPTFTEAARVMCKESLTRAVFVLCELGEIVSLLERGHDLTDFLRRKVTAAILHKQPLFKPLDPIMHSAS